MVDLDRIREWNRALSVRELDPAVAEHRRYYVDLATPGHREIDEIAASIEMSIASEVYTVPPVAPVLFPGFATHFGNRVLHQIAVPRVFEQDSHELGGLDPNALVQVLAQRFDVAHVIERRELDRVIAASGGISKTCSR